MKVGIITGPHSEKDAVRGIGMHTGQLVDYLKKLKGIEIGFVRTEGEDLSKYDLLHYQKFHPYFFSLPFRRQLPSVLTIHDLIYLIYPKAYPSGIKGALRFWIQKILVKRIDAIITISETSKKDIVRFLGIPQEKVFPIHLAPRKIFRKLEGGSWKLEVKRRYGLPEDFVLYVGDVNYNKNVMGLAEACKKANIPLVIVGKQAASVDFDKFHPENRPLVELLDKYGGDKEVIRLGFVPDNDLVAIYNLASLYCQPSFYEGFGLSVLEAMAAGTPVVAAKTQALVEIGEGACLFADPKDPKDIAEKISSVLEDVALKNQLVETGKVLVRNYSWEKTAKETLGVYRKVVGR